MATREVDETEYMAAQQVIGAVNAMLSNPEARKRVLEAQKIVAPNSSIPEIDAAEPFKTELQKLREEMAAERKAREDEKAEREAAGKRAEFAAHWEKQKKGLREAGYNAEGIEKIEKFAEERGIADLEAAEALFARMNPQTIEPPTGVLGFDAFQPERSDNDFVKKMYESQGENNPALDAEITATLREIRGSRRAA